MLIWHACQYTMSILLLRLAPKENGPDDTGCFVSGGSGEWGNYSPNKIIPFAVLGVVFVIPAPSLYLYTTVLMQVSPPHYVIHCSFFPFVSTIGQRWGLCHVAFHCSVSPDDILQGIQSPAEGVPLSVGYRYVVDITLLLVG